MGDAGEGLVDAEGRIQERMDEIEETRKRARIRTVHGDSEKLQRLESLRLARADLERQFEATQHETRRGQLRDAMTALDGQAEALRENPTLSKKASQSKKLPRSKK
jgi:hypothetical protein